MSFLFGGPTTFRRKCGQGFILHPRIYTKGKPRVSYFSLAEPGITHSKSNYTIITKYSANSTSSLWLQKAVVMILYQRILSGFKYANIIMKVYWVILGASYIVIQVVTFTDCRPLKLYWQVVPDPGKFISLLE
jgi:hypothetical protein